MKIIYISLLYMLVGCTWNKPNSVPILPVWTPPTVEFPIKPELISDGKGSDGDIARKVSIDFLYMIEYIEKLENTCKALQIQSADKLQTIENNK